MEQHNPIMGFVDGVFAQDKAAMRPGPKFF
jgi:hypothetical protein